MKENNTIELTVKRTANEMEVSIIQMLADGLRPKDISKKIGKSTKTVEYRIDQLKKAYGCGSYVGLVVLFFRNNLIK